jgi:AbrB family looped-hinge helix DNA binding protein
MGGTKAAGQVQEKKIPLRGGKRRREVFKNNLIQMRKMRRMTQEDVAEKVGVTRQAVAKWESGETVPDLDKCRILAELFGVSLDDLANYEPEENLGLGLPPKGKHLFGMVTVGDKGQIVIPARARKLFDISAGDQLVVLGDEAQGLAVMKADRFLELADLVRKMGTLE